MLYIWKNQKGIMQYIEDAVTDDLYNMVKIAFPILAVSPPTHTHILSHLSDDHAHLENSYKVFTPGTTETFGFPLT